MYCNLFHFVTMLHKVFHDMIKFVFHCIFNCIFLYLNYYMHYLVSLVYRQEIKGKLATFTYEIS